MRQDLRVQKHAELLLGGKDEHQRALLVHGIAERLDAKCTPASDRHAAEELARQLADDAIEMVRQELSKAVRHCQFLPRDVALRIAHDIDSVACPFLEATQVFSEEEWEQLVRTISRNARVAVASRSNLSENLADSLAEVGDVCVAETLIANENAPFHNQTYSVLIERFGHRVWLMERMALREALPPEVAMWLVSRISEAARETLSRTYDLTELTDPLVKEAFDHTLLGVIKSANKNEFLEYAQSLSKTGELGQSLLLEALKLDLLDFFETAMAVRSGISITKVRKLTRLGGADAISRLCEKAGFKATSHQNFCSAVELSLTRLERSSELPN